MCSDLISREEWREGEGESGGGGMLGERMVI